MLYFLIELNPHKDITLHVSINNPAMVRRSSRLCGPSINLIRVPDSFCITVSGSKRKNSSSTSTRTTSTRARPSPRTHSGFGSGDGDGGPIKGAPWLSSSDECAHRRTLVDSTEEWTRQTLVLMEIADDSVRPPQPIFRLLRLRTTIHDCGHVRHLPGI